jgi:MFS family permease
MPRLFHHQGYASGEPAADPRGSDHVVGERYRWIALSNTMIAGTIVSIDGTIVLVALPTIFRGIHLDPLAPANTTYMLWLIMGFLVVTAVLVVSLGRLGDMYGRVRVYTAGFVVFTFFSILLSVTWMHGSAGAIWLVVMRIGQGLGGAMLLANMPAIVADAFPANQRGMALGIANLAFVAGATIGLVLGGLLAPVSWRLIFLVSVPIGLVGTFWSYTTLHDIGERRPARIDWLGNITFASGLIALMVAITTGIQPHGHQQMSWTSAKILTEFAVGVGLLVGFAVIESRVAEPMVDLSLFRSRAFTAGNIANLLTALARGGLQFIVIIWLQGVWLPEHGYNFAQTPLWSGIHMLPNVGGLLLAAPVSGILSDRFGARLFSTTGAVLGAASLFLMMRLPVDFPYPLFAALLVFNGIAMGIFLSPNRAAVMNSLPPWHRGVGAGVLNTFQNAGTVLSTGVFFSLMTVGLARHLPATLYRGFVAHGVPRGVALHASHLPPVTTLFATFLGYNPVAHLLGHRALAGLPAGQASLLTGRSFFPHLISGPFSSALTTAFDFAVIACLLAAAASLSRGGQRHWAGAEEPVEPPTTSGVSFDEPPGVTNPLPG